MDFLLIFYDYFLKSYLIISYYLKTYVLYSTTLIKNIKSFYLDKLLKIDSSNYTATDKYIEEFCDTYFMNYTPVAFTTEGI